MKKIWFILFFAMGFISCEKSIYNLPEVLVMDSLKTISSNIPAAVYSDLTFISANTGFAITQGMVAKTTDGGMSWSRINMPVDYPLNKIQFTDNNHGYIIGGDNSSGFLLKTTDGGEHWNYVDLDAIEAPSGLWFIDNNTGFITGKNLFIKSTDGGNTWQSIKDDTFRMYQDVKFRNSGDGYATSSGGVYYSTTDGGTTWKRVEMPSENYLYDIYFAGSSVCIKTDSAILDITGGNVRTILPTEVNKLLFINSQECIGIGHHYIEGFYPYGDLFITNDGWKNFDQKTFNTVDAINFNAIAKMDDDRIMILGLGFLGTKILILNIK